MTLSPFDHPFLSGLLGDEDVASQFSVEAEIAAMVAFECALAETQAAEGVIESAAASAIVSALASFRPDIAALREGVARDGVVVPALVRQLRAAVGEPHGPQVHFGATSQDVIDTGLMLRLKPVIVRLDELLAQFTARLSAIDSRFGDNPIMGRTRMQASIPITVSDRVRTWLEPLLRHRTRLAGQREDLLVVQFGGAAGTLETFGDKAQAVRKALAARLGLSRRSTRRRCSPSTSPSATSGSARTAMSSISR